MTPLRGVRLSPEGLRALVRWADGEEQLYLVFMSVVSINKVSEVQILALVVM